MNHLRWTPPDMIHPPLLDHATRCFGDPAAPRPPDQSLLPEGPERELRQARAHADARPDEFRGDDARHWTVQYWDENLLEGRPPFEPMPEVVGITVHLTFAKRAFELARWYRSRGEKVVLGGLHVLSCPEECAPHADALAVGDGVQLWPRICRRGVRPFTAAISRQRTRPTTGRIRRRAGRFCRAAASSRPPA